MTWTASARLLSGGKAKTMLISKVIQRLLAIVFILATPISFAQKSEGSSGERSLQEFPDFPSLRTDVLAKFGSASKRIWLATDFLTDAEIVSSLFIAQYRKVNISVLLGKDRATNILSRLNYLKQVNIPVALRPKEFYAKHPTILLIDNQLYALSIPLDYMTRTSRSSLEPLGVELLQDFELRFNEAAKLQNAPKMAPLPQVGRSRPNSRYYKITESKGTAPPSTPSQSNSAAPRSGSSSVSDMESAQPAKPSPYQSKTSNDGTSGQNASYRYRSGRQKPPEGIPTRLPKTTLRQELQRERERMRNNDQEQGSPAE
jgi:hypothetical protein